MITHFALLIFQSPISAGLPGFAEYHNRHVQHSAAYPAVHGISCNIRKKPLSFNCAGSYLYRSSTYTFCILSKKNNPLHSQYRYLLRACIRHRLCGSYPGGDPRDKDYPGKLPYCSGCFFFCKRKLKNYYKKNITLRPF